MLRQVRQAVRERALHGAESAVVLPPPLHPRTPTAMPPVADPPPVAHPPRPDATGVNSLWNVRPSQSPSGLRGWLARLAQRLLAPTLESQVAFNSRQVQLDNEILAYVDARLEGTHRHYDEILGVHGRHMGEIDERHLILQEELVAHVHDLVKRIDLVLSESERGRMSLDYALRDVRSRLQQLEERLARE